MYIHMSVACLAQAVLLQLMSLGASALPWRRRLSAHFVLLGWIVEAPGMASLPVGGRWKAVCPEGRRSPRGHLVFKPKPGSSPELQELVASFRPTKTPEEVLRAGAFGGTYFRDIKSSVTGKAYKDAWKELPPSWLKGLNIASDIARPWAQYSKSVNKYGAKCGNTLEDWEAAGWMSEQDPYGWFQWYCRFYQGRRTDDDDRQIRRWAKICGPNGRWKGNLVAKCVAQDRSYDDPRVAPAVRQSLLHWAYELTAEDLDSRKAAILSGKGAYALPREQLAQLHRRRVDERKKATGVVLKRPAASVGASRPQKRVRS